MSTTAMQGISQDVEEVVGLLFQSSLEMAAPDRCDPGAAYTVGASLDISGEWCGQFIVLADELAANSIAGALFGSAEGRTEEDRGEAICEAANMLGGNVKALLPGPSKLGLPSTVGAMASAQGDWANGLSFVTAEGGHFAVRLEGS